MNSVKYSIFSLYCFYVHNFYKFVWSLCTIFSTELCKMYNALTVIIFLLVFHNNILEGLVMCFIVYHDKFSS